MQNRLIRVVPNLQPLRPADNMQDMVQKGRSTAGERNPMARLTQADVREIRRLLGLGTYFQNEIAHRFNVSPQVIHYIKTGYTWANS